MNIPEQHRFHYLDSLRGFLMSVGVVLHAGGIVPGEWYSASLMFVSNMFRMKLFFLVSGFFIALAIQKKGVKGIFVDRVVRIGVPCALFVIFANPISGYFVYMTRIAHADFWPYVLSFFSDAPDFPGSISWHIHLWFLVVLLAYSLAIAALFPLAKKLSAAEPLQWLAQQRPATALFVLAVGVTLVFVSGRVLHYLLFQRYLHGGPFNFPVQAILWYLPYFVFGMVLFMNRSLFELMHRVSTVHAAAAVSAVVLCYWIYPVVLARYGMAVAELTEHLLKGFAGFIMCAVTLAAFQRFCHRPSRWSRYLADASYTVFLVHFLFISIVQYVLVAMGLPKTSVYLLSILMVYALCIGLHYSIVTHSRLAAFLINGRPLPKALPANLAST